MNRVFVVFTFIILLCFSYSCDNKVVTREIKDMSDTEYVYIDGGAFKLKNEKYFPLMLNYILSYRNINDEFIVSPHIDYEEVGVYESNTKEDIQEQLRAHFQLIREMGFNSVRLCFDRVSVEEDRIYYGADGKKYFIDSDYAVVLNGLESVIDIAEEKDLRVMLLIKSPVENKDLENFSVRILEKFSSNPVIFSYDFMNEPLYFDTNPNRAKKEACGIVTRWMEMVNGYAPNQLFTIGFSEPIEVFEWDPELLPVDFIAFHTYHPLRVKNEVYWYSTYVNKPWMIGETSLPAENDSVPYEDQAMFMKDLYEYVVDCGGAGFGWWDFQEGVWGNFEAKYTGMLNHEGTTTTSDGKYTVIGTVKPVAEVIPGLLNYKPKAKEIPVNYFNMMGYDNIVIKGRILDKKTKEPVGGAVIRGWNEWWTVGLNTFTNGNGEFTIYSNDECVHFAISAPGMETVTFNKNLKYRKIVEGSYDMKDLPDKKLEYHSISYVPFLNEGYVSVFDFDAGKFGNAKFEGDLGIIYLSQEKGCY